MNKHDKRTHHRGFYQSKANREIMPLHDLITVSRTSTLQRSYPYVHFIEDLRESQEVVDAKPVETKEIVKGDPKRVISDITDGKKIEDLSKKKPADRMRREFR